MLSASRPSAEKLLRTDAVLSRTETENLAVAICQVRRFIGGLSQKPGNCGVWSKRYSFLGRRRCAQPLACSSRFQQELEHDRNAHSAAGTEAQGRLGRPSQPHRHSVAYIRSWIHRCRKKHLVAADASWNLAADREGLAPKKSVVGLDCNLVATTTGSSEDAPRTTG